MKAMLYTIMTFFALARAPSVPVKVDPHVKFVRVAKKEVGVRESGKNSGEVDKYLKAVGLGGSHAPYCAAFIVWVGDQAFGREKNPVPRSAWSPDLVRGGRRPSSSSPPKKGEIVGFWFRSKGRIAHVGIADKSVGNSVVTIEANTSSTSRYGEQSDREGQGVYRKLRPVSVIHRTRDWMEK